jgi:hypothetical protein
VSLGFWLLIWLQGWRKRKSSRPSSSGSRQSTPWRTGMLRQTGLFKVREPPSLHAPSKSLPGIQCPAIMTTNASSLSSTSSTSRSIISPTKASMQAPTLESHAPRQQDTASAGTTLVPAHQSDKQGEGQGVKDNSGPAIPHLHLLGNADEHMDAEAHLSADHGPLKGVS